MYTDFDLRKQLVRPWFWVKMAIIPKRFQKA
jgi:hypothetical protein